MAFLVNHLMDERGAGSRHVEPREEDPRWFMEQWEQFRALVNTREPEPASPEFLKVQDRVLQLMVAEPGITEADELARTASDPRLSIWRGDITALRCDAIVNAANSALLGCWIPGHLLHRQRHPHLRRRAAAPEVRANHAGTRLRGAGRPCEGHARL